MSGELTDTSPEVGNRHRELLSARSGEERLRMAGEMFDAARRLVLSSLPMTGDPVERRVQILRRFYGRHIDPGSLEKIIAAVRQRE